MTRQFSIMIVAAALAAPVLAGDRAERLKWDTDKYLSRGGEESGPTRSALAVRGVRSKAVQSRSAEADASNPPMAPGVVQVNLFDTGREAYFVVTETLPKGSRIQAFIILADKTELALESRNVDEDLPPGFTLYLTGIKTLGDFWKRGLTTYEVDVQLPNGTVAISATDFATKGFFRDFASTAYYVPGINSAREFIAGDGSTIVEIKGRFLAGKKTYVVFEDIVAPQTAITVVDQDTIQVNLSQVPNLDVTVMKSYLLTVGQDGWTDTAQFRHTPLQ